ncbi:hypothetical protein HPB48_008732 [Haemaphysalis longicornis]|uniref:Uncharacterized protein n=1 Tax=Haemaphysalis longicornis TaxID=44386 RepID=A0A9J6FWY5_HAELO|nr:hypothetical protein HPB48_008732 [Haemaphysalis longicornis]
MKNIPRVFLPPLVRCAVVFFLVITVLVNYVPSYQPPLGPPLYDQLSNKTPSPDVNVVGDISADINRQIPRDEADINHLAWLLSHSIRINEDPCQNFHSYVCGNYYEVGNGSLISLLAENLTSAIHRHFISIGLDKPEPPSEAVLKAARFYKSCLRPVHKNGETHALASFFKENNLSFESDIVGFLDITLEILLRYGLGIFFTIELDWQPQYGQTTRYLRLGASDPFEEWKNTRKTMQRRGNFASLAKQVILATGYGTNGVTILINQIWFTESKLLDGTGRLKRRQNLPELVARWRELLHLYTNGALPGPYRLQLKSKAALFFHRMLYRAEGGQQSVYVIWELARHLAVVSGLITLRENQHWPAYCYNISYAIFGPAIAAPILFKSANSSKLDQVRRMSETLVKEIQISIESSTWLRRETRAHLSRKLGLVKWKLGYAPGLEDWPGLEKRFRDYPTATGVFLADYVKTKEVHARTLYRIIASNNSFESNNFKSDVVGAFLKGPSTLFVSAASVLSPLFCYGAPPEVNYGLLGSLVLRNLMSAFRPTNILYDGNGSTIPWTTEERGIFEDRYQCDLFTEEANSSSGPAATISIRCQGALQSLQKSSLWEGKEHLRLATPRSPRGRSALLRESLLPLLR